MPNQFVMSEQSVLKGPLWITDIDHDGRGIGRTDGKVVFVADALPGETVWWQNIREKKNLIEGRARQWRDYSDVRRSPPCAYAVRCGGCQWQHIDDAAQVAFKQRVFEAQLRRIGQVWPTQILAPIYGLPWHYRERVRFSIRHVASSVVLGFQAAYSHEVVDIDACPVLAHGLSAAIGPIKSMLRACAQYLGIRQVQLCEGDEVSALLIEADRPFAQAQQPQWQACMHVLSRQSGRPWQLWWVDKKNMPRPSQPVYATGVGSLHYRLPEYQVNIAFTPQDFTQVNGRTNALMVHRAMALLQPQADELIVDWFCGLGNFSLPMARLGANVIGIEGVAAMVSKAQANAKANGLSAQAQFGQADLFAVTDIDAVRWGVADKWLLDPPRAGAQALVQALHGLPENKLPKRVVYVSCNPGTLARDAGILVARGYRFSAAGIMNLFAQTAHVESIAVFDWP